VFNTVSKRCVSREGKIGKKILKDNKTPPKKVSPKKVSPKKVSPKKVSPKKVSLKKVSLKKVSLKKVSLKKVSPKKVSPKKVSLKKVSLKKVSPKKVSPKKVSPKKVSPKKTPPKKCKKQDKWEIIIHASNPKYMQTIKDTGGLKVGLDQLHKWLRDSDQKEIFNNYFLKKDNRFKIVDTFAKYGSDLTRIKDLDLSDETLYKIPKKKGRLKYNYVPGIYTYYIWNNLNYDGDCWSFGCDFPLIFGISTEILKDKAWFACPKTMAGRCVVEDKLLDGFYSRGNLSNKPDMTNIKNHLNKKINNFGINHEIIFQEIPLKYIKVIFVTKKYFDDAKKIFPNIPVEIIGETKDERKNYKKILEPHADKI
jgi:hypothetical protein